MFDVVVIGAGIVGAACARKLAMLDRSVLVIDSGATAGGTSSQGEGNLLLSDKAPGPELLLAQYADGSGHNSLPTWLTNSDENFPRLSLTRRVALSSRQQMLGRLRFSPLRPPSVPPA